MGPYCKTLLSNTLFYLFVLGVISCGGGNGGNNTNEKVGDVYFKNPEIIEFDS